MLLVGLPEAGKKTEAHEARIEASHPSSRRKIPPQQHQDMLHAICTDQMFPRNI
jgi:hypothetical protein